VKERITYIVSKTFDLTILLQNAEDMLNPTACRVWKTGYVCHVDPLPSAECGRPVDLTRAAECGINVTSPLLPATTADSAKYLAEPLTVMKSLPTFTINP
jgi:hypothetical protein